jgi:hypothetical protein
MKKFTFHHFLYIMIRYFTNNLFQYDLETEVYDENDY